MGTGFLPMSRSEVQERGWDGVDFVAVTGDAYVDHPSFGIAVISRVLESYGYRIAILSQPRWDPDFDEISRGFDGFAKLYLCSLLGGNQNVFPIKELVSVSSRSINVLQGEENLLLDELRGYTAMRYQTLMLTESQTRVKRLASRLMEEGIPRQGCYRYCQGRLA